MIVHLCTIQVHLYILFLMMKEYSNLFIEVVATMLDLYGISLPCCSYKTDYKWMRNWYDLIATEIAVLASFYPN